MATESVSNSELAKTGVRCMNIRTGMMCAALLSSMTAMGQIYEHTDKDGNVSFSDRPTPGAEEVELQNTNTANSVEVPPPTPAKPEAVPAPAETAYTDGGPVVIGGSDDDLVEARRIHERREAVKERIGEGAPGENPVVTPHRPPAQVHPRPSAGRR